MDKDFETKAINEIREKVKDDIVVCAISGGVDSMVMAKLIDMAVPGQLFCIHVDHGMMRLNESKNVEEIFKEHFQAKLLTINAEERFLTKLKGVEAPEEKRKIIGKEFIDIFEEEAKKIKNAKWLAQGTILPDIEESKKDNVIKSHHNVGGLPERMSLKLLEPIAPLCKPDVRELGFRLGLPQNHIRRHPFPGPGLGVRVVGQEITKEKLDMLRQADDIFINAITNAGIYDHIFQAFAALLNTKAVGVKEGKRTYGYTVALRAVISKDAMTAKAFEFNSKLLNDVSEKIMKIDGISRVLYDITDKPNGTIEWE